MKKSMILAAFTLSAMVFAGAQQPADSSAQSGAQATSPNASSSSQVPGAASQASPATPGAAQSAPDASAQSAGQSANGPITEGCLAGSNPNFTLTGTDGKSYKLVLPANADGSKLTAHVGESIAVMGDVSGSSINVSKVGKGSGTCPAK